MGIGDVEALRMWYIKSDGGVGAGVSREVLECVRYLPFPDGPPRLAAVRSAECSAP